MDAVSAVFLGVSVVWALALLGWLRIKWNALSREYQRDLGWQLMWHERIMDERDDAAGPP